MDALVTFLWFIVAAFIVIAAVVATIVIKTLVVTVRALDRRSMKAAPHDGKAPERERRVQSLMRIAERVQRLVSRFL